MTNLEKILGICVIKGYKTPINKTLKKTQKEGKNSIEKWTKDTNTQFIKKATKYPLTYERMFNFSHIKGNTN